MTNSLDPAPPPRSRRPLFIGLALVAAFVLVFATRRAAMLSNVGNRGGAVGVFIGPFVWYAVLPFIMTFIARLMKGHEHTRFATSRSNYVTAWLVIFAPAGVLTRGQPWLGERRA